MNNKPIMISNQKLCGYLMLNGFVLINMRPNNDGSGRNVFFFNNSENIKTAIRNFKKNNIT